LNTAAVSYQPRLYRNWTRDKDLVSCTVVSGQTDLCIRAKTDLRSRAAKALAKYRAQLERYIERHPEFGIALAPIPAASDAPEIVKAMARAAGLAGVGPMAAVAGAIAGFVGRDMSKYSEEVIVENGGDIFLQSRRKRLVGVFAGDSPLSGKIGLDIQPEETPLGICTSSGTVGHSLSFGKADACIVMSPCVEFADAMATALGNRIMTPADIPAAIDAARVMSEVTGVVIIKGDQMGVWGKVKLVPQVDRE